MPAEAPAEDMIGPVDAIVTVSSDASSTCPICGTFVLDGVDAFDAAVNHVLSHQWTLLHVGSQDLTEADGTPYRTTVAILGRSGARPASGVWPRRLA